MLEQPSFKERVKDVAIQYAPQFKNYFVDYDYLLCSDAFKKKSYYIIQAHEDNYQHLIGVASSIGPATFFEKCAGTTLSVSDLFF